MPNIMMMAPSPSFLYCAQLVAMVVLNCDHAESDMRTKAGFIGCIHSLPLQPSQPVCPSITQVVAPAGICIGIEPTCPMVVGLASVLF